MDHVQAPELRRQHRREQQDPGRAPERPEDRRVHGHDCVHNHDRRAPIPRAQEATALRPGWMGHVSESSQPLGDREI